MFCSGGDAGVNGISAKIETYGVTKVKPDMLSKGRGLRPKRRRQHTFPLVTLFMSIFPQISLPLQNV